MEIKLPIATPPWSSTGKKLEKTIRKALLKFSLLDDKKSISIALSGGKDSLSLLYFLSAINGRGFQNFEIHAIYVKGENSCGAGVTKDFLQAICNKLKVSFHVCKFPEIDSQLDCYHCSRIRRKLIFDKAKELNATTIAFGHHRNDQTETLLLNLFHKGEFASMLPKLYMHDYEVTIIRPLILIDEKDIITFAKQNNFLRFSCQCPNAKNSKRNEIKNLLLQLKDMYPHINTNLSHAALIYGSDKAKEKKHLPRN